MILDFKEIPKANGGDGLQDTFELFTRDFLAYLGYRIVRDPDRGADGKKDMIVDEVIKGVASEYTIRWLVSCKHNAHSGTSVKDTDEINITERLNQHKCDSFMGVYSTLSSTSLSGILSNVKHVIFDREKIESFLLRGDIDGQIITARYFPKSFKEFQIENPVPAKIYRNHETITCENCEKELLGYRGSGFIGNYVLVGDLNSPNGERVFKDVYFTCKNCDELLESHYNSFGLRFLGWNDTADLCVPTLWIQSLMAFLNDIYGGRNYEKKAFDKMKDLFIKTYPYVARHLTTEEKKRVSSLNFHYRD